MDLAIKALVGRTVSTVCLAVLGASLAAAQTNGDIRLQIKDPSGAAVRASGTLRNLDAKTETHFETDALGIYEFTNLPYNR